jgi:hypothetical protein
MDASSTKGESLEEGLCGGLAGTAAKGGVRRPRSENKIRKRVKRKKAR